MNSENYVRLTMHHLFACFYNSNGGPPISEKPDGKNNRDTETEHTDPDDDDSNRVI